MKLAIGNILRTSWIAGAMLHTQPAKAQVAGCTLLRHLDTTHPDKRTPFEKHLCESPELMRSITDFATRDVPVCLWQGGGTYKYLFQLLALRFLLAPDQVLDCERAHARWNWLCLSKRALRMPLLNASLRLTRWLESHMFEFPMEEDISKHLSQETHLRRVALAEANTVEDLAPGSRQELVDLRGTTLALPTRHSSLTTKQLPKGHWILAATSQPVEVCT